MPNVIFGAMYFLKNSYISRSSLLFSSAAFSDRFFLHKKNKNKKSIKSKISKKVSGESGQPFGATMLKPISTESSSNI
jgi:hypothetical protein